MQLIKPSFEILEQEPGLQGIYNAIERAGRTCYKSEAFITDDSAEKFVKMIIDRGHTAMLEHGTIYLKVPFEIFNDIDESITYKPWNSFSSGYNRGNYTYLTTNYRWIIESNLESWLEYLCEPTEFHEQRISVKFVCDRGVSHEFVRHRVFSFAQESTRYCNYSNTAKFGDNLTFIIPSWIDAITNNSCYNYDSNIEEWQKSEDANTSNFLQSIAWSEKNYLTLLHNKWTPQQARSVLPNSLKTELVMTGTISQWKGFFKLRCAKDAHPQAQELATPLQEKFKELKYV